MNLEEEMQTERQAEVWKDIEGFEGMYQVSNLGRVKSLARFKRKKDKIIKGSPNTVGYLVVQLRKDGVRKSMLVHRLVMLTFQPCEVQDELVVNHKDLNILNNVETNLEWVTQKINNEHYWNTADLSQRKETPFGESHHLAKLTEDDVREMRNLYWNDIITNVSQLGRMFGVKEGAARAIVNMKTWKHIK